MYPVAILLLLLLLLHWGKLPRQLCKTGRYPLAPSPASQQQDDVLAAVTQLAAIKRILMSLPMTTAAVMKRHWYVRSVLALHA